MYQIKNFQDNDDVRTSLISSAHLPSSNICAISALRPALPLTADYCNEMNVRKRQVLCDLAQADITVQAGAMQWMVGDVKATTGVKGVGDLLGQSDPRQGNRRIGDQAGIHRQRHLGAGADLQTFNLDGCRRMERLRRS